MIHLYASYTLDRWSRDLNKDFTVNNCLTRSVKLTENAEPAKYRYISYSRGFSSRSEFSFRNGSIQKNVIIFATNISSSVDIDNKNKDILILCEGATQGLDDQPKQKKQQQELDVLLILQNLHLQICIKSAL